MLFNNFLDDGEAEAGAARPGRHIGLGNAVAVLNGQSDAIVSDGDRQLVGIGPGGQADVPGLRTFRAAVDGFCSVLQQVGQRLRNLSTVTDQRWQAVW